MTDRPTPITDEDLSAHLDGEAAPDLATRIAADPDAQVRLDALRGSARAVADMPVLPLGDAVVDQLISRALRSVDEDADTAGDPVTMPTVPLERGRAPAASDQRPSDPGAPSETLPHSARRLPPTWLVAAAVVLVVALGIGLVVTGRDTGSGTQAANTAATDTTGGGQAAGSKSGAATLSDANTQQLPDHGGGAGVAPSTTVGRAFAAADVVDLGSFDSPDALRRTLAARFPDTPATPASGGAPAIAALQRCGTQVAVTLDLKRDPLHIGYGTVAGRQVLVYEFPSTSYTDKAPTTLVVAVGTQACDPVLSFQR